MKIFDLLTISLGNLFKKKTRALLTLFGVTLGAASVTLTFAIGEAVKQNGLAVLQNSKDLKMIEVSSNTENNSAKKCYIDDDFIDKAKKMNGVKSIFYCLDITNSYLSCTAGKKDKYNSYNQIYGVNFEDLEKFGLKLINNQHLPSSNYKFQTSNKTIRVITSQYFEYFFYTEQKHGKYEDRYENSPPIQYMYSKWNPDFKANPLPPFFDASKERVDLRIQYPNNIKTKMSEYDLDYDPEEEQVFDDNQNPYKYKRYQFDIYDRYNWEAVKDDPVLSSISTLGIFIDLDTAKTLVREANKLNKVKDTDKDSSAPEFEYSYAVIEANSIDDVLGITQEFEKNGYNVYNLMSAIEKEQIQAQSNQFILGFLGALALLVSAISIANTMITSVYERTKEIGIMKVLGCKLGNITTMFLIESGSIGLIGGSLGVGCSYLLSNFMNKLVSAETEDLGFLAQIISNFIAGMKSDFASYLGGESVMKVAAVDFKLCLLVIIGTTLISLCAGYIPAVVASKIEALKAIKTSK